MRQHGSIRLCSVTLSTDPAEMLKAASFIIWDECPMMHRWNFEALDRCLRDVMRCVDPACEDLPFGGKVSLLSEQQAGVENIENIKSREHAGR